MPGHPCEQGFDLKLIPEKLGEPWRWTSPKAVFVNSMSDLLHEDVAERYSDQVARVMEVANWHTYQVLTKRANRLQRLLSTRPAESSTGGPTMRCQSGSLIPCRRG